MLAQPAGWSSNQACSSLGSVNPDGSSATKKDRPGERLTAMKATAYFRDLELYKHLGLEEAMILRVLDELWRDASRLMGATSCGVWCRKPRTVRSGSLSLRTERPFTTPSLIAVPAGNQPIP